MRIVSLLPSATESLYLLLGEAAHTPDAPTRLIARSHECDFPPGPRLASLPQLTRSRTRFTSAAQVDHDVRQALATHQSLYELDVDVLARLKPDLIITQNLCGVCSIDLAAVHRVAASLSPQPRVISLNPETFDAVLDDLLTLGEALNIPTRAREIVATLRERMFAAEEFVNPFAHKPVVGFLEWTDPLFVAGHWTPQLIERAGGAHPLNPTFAAETAGAGAGPIGASFRRAAKSFLVPPHALVASQPDALIICPCGLSLAQATHETTLLANHAWFRELPAVRNNRVAIVDGHHMFNRPGPRLVDAFEFLVAWLNQRPELIPPAFPWQPYRTS